MSRALLVWEWARERKLNAEKNGLRDPGMTSSEVAKSLGLSTKDTSGTLRDMKEFGSVRREPLDERDRKAGDNSRFVFFVNLDKRPRGISGNFREKPTNAQKLMMEPIDLESLVRGNIAVMKLVRIGA